VLNGVFLSEKFRAGHLFLVRFLLLTPFSKPSSVFDVRPCLMTAQVLTASVLEFPHLFQVFHFWRQTRVACLRRLRDT
jgi:hypothetical protein